MKQIPNSLAVFCMATYGEGDPTDNAMEFYEWLQNGDADLTGLNYAVSAFKIRRFNVVLENLLCYLNFFSRIFGWYREILSL